MNTVQAEAIQDAIKTKRNKAKLRTKRKSMSFLPRPSSATNTGIKFQKMTKILIDSRPKFPWKTSKLNMSNQIATFLNKTYDKS